jgi:geranylgeranyl transferase type-2 subunit beta
MAPAGLPGLTLPSALIVRRAAARLSHFPLLDILSRQLESGAFTGDEFGEIDTRFSYCAVASLALLGRLDALKADLTIAFIRTCKNFDGGYGAIPGSESHGGNVFCVVSLLAILGRLEAEECADREALLQWLVWRQLPGGGLNGRPEKLEDVCYSWWIVAALVTLKASHLIDTGALKEFILKCQDAVEGGFADRPGDVGDVFHTLFGLAGLSFVEFEGVGAIDSCFCLPK